MHISGWKNFIALFSGLLMILSVRADTHHLRFLQTQWTSETGLPQNSVTSIAQTDEGYLWVGTFGGLARFDGVRFKVFTPANTPEMINNRIVSLATDQEKNLWIGTERGAIIVYRDGKFRLVDDGKSYENKIIHDIFVDDAGKVWIGGFGGGKTCTWQGCEMFEFPNKNIYKFRQDSTGKMWAYADTKLYYSENGRFVQDEKVKFEVLNFETNPNGGLWMVTYGQMGTYRDGKFTPLIQFDKNVVTTPLTNHPDGSLWFNQSQTLYQIKGEKIDSYERLCCINQKKAKPSSEM